VVGLRAAPSDQAVRNALTALCPQAKTLERRLNASFAAQLPKAVKGRRWRLAIDLNLRPYYGQAQHRIEEVYRSQAKCGTTHFHAYATCYLVHRGRRYTVALTPVEQGTPRLSKSASTVFLTSGTAKMPIWQGWNFLA
jgi:putative transposase